jgi:hypothetical protein
MVADELRRQADVFTDLVELQAKIGRDPAERIERGERVDRRQNPAERGHTPQFLQRSPVTARAEESNED